MSRATVTKIDYNKKAPEKSGSKTATKTQATAAAPAAAVPGPQPIVNKLKCFSHQQGSKLELDFVAKNQAAVTLCFSNKNNAQSFYNAALKYARDNEKKDDKKAKVIEIPLTTVEDKKIIVAPHTAKKTSAARKKAIAKIALAMLLAPLTPACKPFVELAPLYFDGDANMDIAASIALKAIVGFVAVYNSCLDNNPRTLSLNYFEAHEQTLLLGGTLFGVHDARLHTAFKDAGGAIPDSCCVVC